MKNMFRFSAFLLLHFLFSKTIRAQVSVENIMYNGSPNSQINFVIMGDGYTSAQLNNFILDATNLSNQLFGTASGVGGMSPFKEYRNFFNVYAIRVPSAESGADHPNAASDCQLAGPHPTLSVNTYFGSTFDAYNTHRLLVSGTYSINSILSSYFPNYDQSLMLVNSAYYGGSGGPTATSSTNSQGVEIMAHEIAHSFAQLADEYWAGDAFAYERANLTQNNNPASVKWKNWITPGTGIGVYQHSGTGQAPNWYKPSLTCKMDVLGNPFCAVCKEAIIGKIYEMVGDPIVSHLPATSSNINVSCMGSSPLTFSVSTLNPIPNTLNIKWTLNGNPIQFNQNSLSLYTNQLIANSTNVIRVEVKDTTSLSRKNPIIYSRSWNVNFSPPFSTNITANGPLSFCQGGSVRLTSSSGDSYLWNNGATTRNITALTSGNYFVAVTDYGGCSVMSNPITVSVFTASISVTGSPSFCQPGSVILTASNADSYLWNTGATTKTITAINSGNYFVTNRNNTGCVANSQTVTVTAHPNPVPIITTIGNTTICMGSTVTLSASLASGYKWNNGETGRSIVVSSSGIFTVTVTNSGGCTNVSQSVSTTYVNLPSTPSISPSGSTTFCQPGSVTLNASSVGANTTYLWNTGATTRFILVSSSGNYFVRLLNCSGASPNSNTITVTVNSNPTPTVTAGAPTTFCEGDSVVLSASSGTSYVWNNSATTQQIKIFNGGSFWVSVRYSNGCFRQSLATGVSVISNPVPAITANGSTTLCEGTSVLLSVTSTVSNGSQFLWNNGQTSQSVNASASGNYRVTVTNNQQCSRTSNTIAVTVNPNPIPTITPNGPTTFNIGGSVVLRASTGIAYLWSNGASTQDIFVASSGVFTVTVTNSFGCSNKSAPITVTEFPMFTRRGIVVLPPVESKKPISSLDDSVQKTPMQLEIYPNPNSGVFTIEIKNATDELFTLSLLNDIGQVVYSEQLYVENNLNTKEIRFTYNVPGLYFLRLSSKEQLFLQKMVVK